MMGGQVQEQVLVNSIVVMAAVLIAIGSGTTSTPYRSDTDTNSITSNSDSTGSI